MQEIHVARGQNIQEVHGQGATVSLQLMIPAIYSCFIGKFINSIACHVMKEQIVCLVIGEEETERPFLSDVWVPLYSAVEEAEHHFEIQQQDLWHTARPEGPCSKAGLQERRSSL